MFLVSDGREVAGHFQAHTLALCQVGVTFTKTLKEIPNRHSQSLGNVREPAWEIRTVG